MNKQIEHMVVSCGECQRLQASKETPPLLPHEVPEKPWQKVGTDLFQLGATNYLIVTDYYSNWPELYELKKANSANVIQATKEAFARHSIPSLIMDHSINHMIIESFQRTGCSYIKHPAQNTQDQMALQNLL